MLIQLQRAVAPLQANQALEILAVPQGTSNVLTPALRGQEVQQPSWRGQNVPFAPVKKIELLEQVKARIQSRRALQMCRDPRWHENALGPRSIELCPRVVQDLKTLKSLKVDSSSSLSLPKAQIALQSRGPLKEVAKLS